MSRVFLCTTGTSIAAGLREEQTEAKQGNDGAYRRAIQKRVAAVRSAEASVQAFLRRVSAETNSLLALTASSADRVVLLHTETGDGRACALELATLLQRDMEVSPVLRQVDGLQVDDPERFRRQGIQSLFRLLEEEGRQGEEVFVNVTGGFKAVVPYATLFGLLYRRQVTYLFENSPALLTLPPAPVAFDWERLGLARQAILELERRTAMPRDEFFARIPGLPHGDAGFYETLLEPVGDEVTLSTFGLLVLESARERQASVRLSPSARRTYEQAHGLERAQVARLVERVADPLWRRAHLHPFHGTDLDVYKMDRTALRLAAMQTPTEVLICEIFTSHDTYERVLPTRQRADYDRTAFSAPPSEPAQPHSGETTDKDPVEELLADAHRERDEAMQMAELFERDTRQLREELGAAKKRASAAEQRAHELETRLARVHHEAAQKLEAIGAGLRGINHRLAELSERKLSGLGFLQRLWSR